MEAKVFYIFICPACGKQVDAEESVKPGHYHDPPRGWPHDEDPWFDGVKTPVVSLADVHNDVPMPKEK